MKERPILFSAPMVRAILNDQKTQTRRVVRWKPREPGLNLLASSMSLGYYCTDVPASGYVLHSRGAGACWNDRTYPAHCPYGAVGDRLWVRETFWHRNGRFHHGGRDVMYAEDVARIPTGTLVEGDWIKRPSIHMPRWASRLSLELTDVRVERLQAITEDDARAEGIQEFLYGEKYGERYISRGYGTEQLALGCMRFTAVAAYCNLWDGLNAKRGYGWEANPYVWVLAFRRMESP